VPGRDAGDYVSRRNAVRAAAEVATRPRESPVASVFLQNGGAHGADGSSADFGRFRVQPRTFLFSSNHGTRETCLKTSILGSAPRFGRGLKDEGAEQFSRRKLKVRERGTKVARCLVGASVCCQACRSLRRMLMIRSTTADGEGIMSSLEWGDSQTLS